jgi:hypothetical protein
MADIKLFDTEKKPGVAERAALKEAINKEKPDTMEYEGLEKVFSPKVREIGTKIGDAAGLVAGWLGSEMALNKSGKKISNYLAEGKSPETKAKADSIVKSNKELMSKAPTTGRQIRLMANAVEESKLNKDSIEDLERTIKNNPNLSESEMEKIKNEALYRWSNDQKPLNNLEATRPNNDVWAHSINTALDFGVLLHEAFPEMSSDEIAKRMESAKLHDYGKSFVRLNDLVTSADFRKRPQANASKKAEVDTHSKRGAEALEELGEGIAAKYAREHHASPNDLETQLLKAADIFNAMTMERVYKGTKDPEAVLKIMETMVVDGTISQEAFNILEKAVNDGKLGDEPKFNSPLEDVYATEAGNAVKQKGIKLFDVETTKPGFAEKFDLINSLSSSIMAGEGVQYLSNRYMDKLSKKAKTKALMEVYKDDKVIHDRLKNGYYSDKAINQMFKDNVDKVIANQKN